MKKLLCVGLILVATAIVAQDAELTKEQQAAKCEAEGGCALFTKKEYLERMLEQFMNGLSIGVQSCGTSV